MIYGLRTILLGAAALALVGCGLDAEPENTTPSLESLVSLQAEFLNPPNSSKPRTWFHAMSGNMSKAGITKDLESIKSVGIGGVLLFNVTQGIPRKARSLIWGS